MLIYDALGNLKTLDWLRAKYGNVEAHTLPTTGPCWRVFALVEDADYPGHKPTARPSWWPKPAATAALVAKTLSADGDPAAEVPVARYWPDAPILPPAQAHWQPRGVIGYTNTQGDTGFGMGNGDYYTPPQQAGVSWIWVAQPDQAPAKYAGVASEAVSGLGMLAGTNHSHINVVFRYDSGHEEPPPDDELIALLRIINANVARIAQEMPCR